MSLESKLSEAGVISQITTAPTCMTTGSPARFDSPWGAVEFTHTDRRIDVGQTSSRMTARWKATVRTAVRDLRGVGRNLDLIDEETLTDAIEEEKRQHEQQSERP